MNDSADMKIAADRLQNALRSLEGALDPLLTRVSGLETALNESKALAEDRASLATALDEANAKTETFAAREKEFNDLADETTAELDRVIKKVRLALGED